MSKAAPDGVRTYLYFTLRRIFGSRNFDRIRLSPLKVLLYLDRNRREERVTTPERLGREVGIGGYDTIKNSYVWLFDRGYIALAPGTPVTGGVAEILDPQDLVVTPLGKRALKPFLAAFSLEEVAAVAFATLGLGFVLGLTGVVLQLYPSYFWILALLDVAFGLTVSYVALLTLREEKGRKKERIASLIESIADRG